MGSYPLPPDEPSRLAALLSCNILDTPPEESFDDIVRMATQLCGLPMGAVTLVDANRQWFKARVGMADPETPREHSFCAHALRSEQPLIVPDAQQDERFASNPYVTGAPHIRFYAGVPLAIDGGSAVGTLCVFGSEPRTLTEAQTDLLRSLARHVARELRTRRELAEARAQREPGALPVREGDLVAGFRLVRRLGQGGTGVVFEGQREGERAALKFLLPEWLVSEEVIERFAVEARVLSELRSPRIGRLLEYGNLDRSRRELPYLVLEYLDGLDLSRVLAERKSVPWQQAVRWVIQVCEGVGEAHRRGVVHRDIKPSNVFLLRDPGGEEAIKVVDFGIAKADLSPSRAPLTQQGVMLGSVYYMAPEQMMSSRDVDARADLWALGALLYELTSGRVPFEGSGPLAVCAAVMRKAPPPLRARAPSVPERLESVVERCLRRDRNDRHRSAEELAGELRALLG